MTGSYEITVRNQSASFRLTIRRNITILQGNSGTGKSTLVGMIADYEMLGKQSGVTVQCKKKCRVLSGADWELRLSAIKDSIVFVDEGNAFIKSDAFARAVRDSDNYYVLITRENLYNLPYSVEEIYELRKYRKYERPSRVFNEMNRLYADVPINAEWLNSGYSLMTEDARAGYTFFLHVADANGVCCVSAHGKSKIFEALAKSKEKVVVIADGSAFGAEMERIYKLRASRPGRIALYLPESFEWLLLQSGILEDGDIREILRAPEKHIESAQFFSWEQYFTHLLCERTQGTYMQYDKTQLAPFYLQEQVVKQVLDAMKK